MVKVGDKVYNWRYGALKVTRIEGDYIYTNILDKEGVINAETQKEAFVKAYGTSMGMQKWEKSKEWDNYLRDPVKVFKLETFGHWLHDNIEDAVFGNDNSFSSNQGQEPAAMQFPIEGWLFHQTFSNILSQHENIRKSITDFKTKIKDAENEIAEYEDEISKLDPVKIIQGLIRECPSENKARKMYLTDYFNNMNKPDFDEMKCAEKVKAEGKSDFSNDAAYKEFIDSVENEQQDISQTIIKCKKKVEELKSKIDIANKNKQEFEIELKALIKYEKLSDSSYVIFA